MTFFDYIDKHTVWTLVYLVVIFFTIDSAATAFANAFIIRRRP